MDYAKHFASKIEATEKNLDEKKGQVAELMAMAEVEERDLSGEESEQLAALATDIEKSEKALADQKKAQTALAERVIEDTAPTILKHRGHQERKPGEIIFKHATAAYLAHVNKKSIQDVAAAVYSGDRGLEAVIRSAQNPADTTTVGWATELTEEANSGYLELLRGASITAQLWQSAGVQLNFDGYTALNVPSRAGGTTDLASGWTGELAAIPVRSATFETQKIEPFKRGAIVMMSKEIMMRSAPAIQGIIQNGLVQDSATKLDNDYLGEAAAVAGLNPAGIFNGVTGTAAATGGATVGDDMLLDLRNLVDPIYAANMGQMLYIVVHPSNALSMSTVLYNGTYLFRSELAQGTLLGIPVIQSTNCPLDEIWALDMAQQAVANGPTTFDVNDTSTIVEMDDDGVAPYMGATQPRNPSGAVSAAAQVPPQTIRSLFQTEAVAVKMVTYQSWANLRDGSVNRITGVDY